MVNQNFYGYTLKNVKTHAGHEGEPCLAATIYKDGRKIGTFSEDEWGGPARLHINDPKEENLLIETAKQWAGDEAWNESYHGMLCAIVDKQNTEKFLKRHCKKETLFSLPGDKPGDYRTVMSPFDHRVKTYLTNKYGSEIVIYNEIIGNSKAA